MKNGDKAIVAFLVSMGLFSAMQARQYVSNLSVKNKKELVFVAELKSKNIILCEGVTDLTTLSETKKTG